MIHRKWLVILIVFWAICLIFKASAEERTLNLKNADIRALISQVAEMTGYNFVVDPRVKGEVTVISSRPMEREEVYQVFLSILSVHGFSAVRTGNVVEVIPESRAKQENIPYADEKGEQGNEVVTRVLQVRNVSAPQLIPILRPLVPQYGHLAAYPTTNVIIISDRASNIARLVNIIERIDTASHEEMEIVPLKHAAASEIVRLLQSLEKQQTMPGMEQTKNTAKFVADERTNSVLLTGETNARTRFKALIAALDIVEKTSGNTQVYYLKYATASDLVPILDGISGNIVTETNEKNPGNIPKKAVVQADEAMNALVISAPPDIQTALQTVIERLDIRRAQVLVEAIIVELQVEKVRDLGVQWALSGGSFPMAGVSFNNSAVKNPNIGQTIDNLLKWQKGTPGGTPDPSIDPTSLGQGGSLMVGRLNNNGFSFAVLARLLSNQTGANLLSTPSLMTLDNVEAQIMVGKNVPFVTGKYPSTGSSNNPEKPFQTIERKDVGVTLKVKPHINESGAITLEIEQEVSSVTEDVKASDVSTNKRSIKTTVLVDNEETIVLGGLIDNTVNETEHKIPLLGDLPLVGNFFKSRSAIRKKSNLMVFLRPTVLRDTEAQKQLSKEKYRFMREVQLGKQKQGVELLPRESVPIMPEFGQSIPPLAPEEFAEIPKKRQRKKVFGGH